MFVFKNKIFLIGVLLALSCNLIEIKSATIETTEITISGIGGARSSSIKVGFYELQNRVSIGDSIAKKLLTEMPSSNNQQKGYIIAAYNAQLKEKQMAQRLAAAAGLEKEKHHNLESLEKSLHEEHYAFGGGDSSSLTITDTLAAPPPRKRHQLVRLLKQYEEKLRKLEKEGGHASRQEILEGAVVGSSGNESLDMLLGYYYKTIADIEKQSQALTEIQRAFFEIQSLYKSALELAKKTDKEIAGPKGTKITEEVLVIEDDSLDVVLAIMGTSNELVERYKTIKFEGIENRMKKTASPEKRVTVLQEIFDDLYITPISDELMRLSNTEYLQQSLKFTALIEQQISAQKALGIYPEQDFVQITGVLSKATTKFLNDIKENDKQTYEEYLPLLEEEAKLLSAVEDLSQMPMTLALFQEPMAFFLLSRPSQNLKVIPFNYIERVERELEYLTEKQKKALFAYLYFISFNFQEVSQKFLKNTLLSATPITPKDIADLIEIVKQDMKAGGQLKLFQPSPSDQGSLGKFSLRVRSLISGEAREKAIVEKFKTEQQCLRLMLNGITLEKINGYRTVNRITDKQKNVINQIQSLWDLVMAEDLPRCDLEKLLAFKEELLQLRNTLGENSELLTKLAVFKNNENSQTKTTQDFAEKTSDESSAKSFGPESSSSSAVLGIMERTISPPTVLKGLNAGLLADISSGLNKQLARKNSSSTSDIPLPSSGAPSFVPPPPSFGPPAPDLNLAEPVAPRIKVLSQAEQKAAATLAAQLQKISNLETALQLKLKADSITTEVYNEITQKIKEVKEDIAAGGMRAAMSERKIKLLDNELATL